ncbi:MAG: alpha/beta hydrolase [Anaerolineae bacterium]|nr:alpha/beta hydrolase [Anaerolineae bacterium]
MYPIYDFGGQGPLINLALANGFPPQTYLPMLRPLLPHYHIVCLLPRALWGGEPVPAQLRQWDQLADDLLAAMNTHGMSQIIAIGHSFGGIASMIALSRQPQRFRALCLLDPTVFQPSWMAQMEAMQRDGSIRDFPLAAGAIRRRRHFEDAGSAYDYFKTKALFADWPEETLRLYAQQGTRPSEAGGVELVWSPEWESYYFSTGYTRSWDIIPQLDTAAPILTIRGGTTDTLTVESAARMRELLPHMTYAEVPGHGHLFPQTAPEQTAAIILDWLKTQGA